MIPTYEYNLPIVIRANQYDNTHTIMYSGKSRKRTIKRVIGTEHYEKKQMVRYFRNEETADDIPMFMPVLSRQVNVVNPEHLEINARLEHNAMMRMVVREINNQIPIYNRKLKQISDEIYELDKICRQKIMPDDAFYNISSYLYS